MASETQHIDRIRTFNRTYIEHMGLLSRDYLGEGLGVTELRALWEISVDPTRTARSIARQLELDEGYLSRVLRRFTERGWLRQERSKYDSRQKTLHLTNEGRAVMDDFVEKSRAKTKTRLDGLQISDVASATDAVLFHLTPPTTEEVQLRDLSHGDLGWVVQRHAEIYAQSHAFDEEFEHLVAEILLNFANSRKAGRERAFIAHHGAVRLGCVFCMATDDADRAQLRLFLIEPSARGLGLGRKLLEACVEFAKAAGYKEMVLMTHQYLSAARHLYAKAGFELVSETPVHNYGQDAIEEFWRLTF